MTVRPWKRPGRLGAGLILALLAVTAGCDAPGGIPAVTRKAPPLQPRVVNGAVYLPPALATREYFGEARRLALSPGITWPTRPLRYASGGSPVFYQRGFGRQAADFYWFCSWARVAAGGGHQVQRAQAMLLLPEIKNLPYFTATLSHAGRAFLARAVGRAERGSEQALRTEIRLNCPAESRSEGA